jgi:hypothetical protein
MWVKQHVFIYLYIIVCGAFVEHALERCAHWGYVLNDLQFEHAVLPTQMLQAIFETWCTSGRHENSYLSRKIAPAITFDRETRFRAVLENRPELAEKLYTPCFTAPRLNLILHPHG